ncbi:GNAT family N-acetyltransferase [Radicibacter daui]|uniref:GNAT family N-acetyltransferase n=1 Tax=Radicibacter daui TaxID=3064829 RepID=UPI004046A717
MEAVAEAPAPLGMIEATFRGAREDDLVALKELYLELIPDESPTLEEMRSTLHEINSRPDMGMVVVGCIDGEVVATCQIVIYPNLVRTPRVKAQVDSVVVASTWRGHGIGKQMMHWCLQELARRNCSRVIVATAYSREVAHKLYSRLGFKQSGYSFVYSE